MGKQINLADLAEEDFFDPVATTAATAAPTAQPDRDAVSAEQTVPIHTVILNPFNKRPPGEDDEIQGMADTIRQHGRVIQPLVVCSAQAFLAEFPAQGSTIDGAAWVVLIGNRRLMACRQAAVDEVPVIVNDVLVSSMYEAMLIENGHHRSLPPMLEAEAMAEVIKKESISNRELARRIGKSHVYVAQRLALLKLVPELRVAFERGELTIELAREFGELSKAEQKRIVAAGKPYRRPGGNAVTTRTTRSRTIRASTPAVAAASIRERFTADELVELIRLLTEAARVAGQADEPAG